VWFTGSPIVPHDACSGVATVVKGTSDVSGANIQYTWDFGDGSAVATGTVSNAYAIEASHTYTGPVGTVFTASLTVRNTSTGESSPASFYYVAIRDCGLEARVNIAIDRGLWYLHKTMGRSTVGTLPVGSWSEYGSSGSASSSWRSVTAANVNAFLSNGHAENGSSDNPYTETVQRAMRRVFVYLDGTVTTSVQNTTIGPINPDGNSNGIAVYITQNNQVIYQTGQFIDAIVATNTPLAKAPTGGANIINRDYQDIVQDLVDFYAHCQTDTGGRAGGWRYTCNTNDADNSTAQWGGIGLVSARGFGSVTINPLTRQLNSDYWLKISQYSGGSYDGAFGYQDGYWFPWGPYATTPSGMVQLALDGVGRGNSRWDRAERFIRDNFANTGGSTTAIKNYYYGLFAFVKAMLLHDSDGDGIPEPIQFLESSTPGVNPIDWYAAEQVGAASVNNTDGVAWALVKAQNAAGYWTGHYYDGGQAAFETAWAILMLNRTIFTAGAPVAVASATPNPAVAFQTITLDGSASFHQDPTKSIVAWEWDLDNNGTYEVSGVTTTVSFSAVGTYPVKLRVRDNSQQQATDDTVVQVVVSTPPVAPTADAGGPYNFCLGTTFFLDGTGSRNADDGQSEPGRPGDFITEYAWDLNGDNQFNDALGAQPDVTSRFTVPGTFLVQLRVTDNTAASFPSSGQPNLTDTDSAQVFVRAANDPECVCSVLTARPKTGQATLVWTTKAGAAGYNVYRSTVSGGPYLKIAATPSTQTVLTDMGLVNGTIYYYVVRPTALNTTEVCQSNQASARPVRR
jgi:hypothetical protein